MFKFLFPWHDVAGNVPKYLTFTGWIYMQSIVTCLTTIFTFMLYVMTHTLGNNTNEYYNFSLEILKFRGKYL